jgi:uncharacterized RDD family membrane protein YckC
MPKKIVVISGLLLILGVVSYSLNFSSGLVFIHYFRLFDFSNVEFINDLSSDSDLIGMFFYLLFFIGIVVYVASKYKETRLLRFIYSLIFISKLLLLPVWLLQLYVFLTEPMPEFSLGQTADFTWIYPYLAIQVLLVLVSFFFLKHFSANKEIVYEEKVYGESVAKIYLEATKSQRFLNYCIDLLLMVLVFFNVAFFLARIRFFESDSFRSSNDSGLVLLIYIVFFRTLYYLIFEGLFRATPGKFLSETKVMDYEGDPVGFKNIFSRSLCRSVPFDSITFLFNFNLHDKWSETAVFQEKRTGVSGVKYMQYFISSLLVLGVIYYGSLKYSEIKRENFLKTSYEEEQNENKKNLDRIAANDVMLIVDCEMTFYNRFLAKVQKVNANKVYCRVVNVSDESINEEYLDLEDSIYVSKGKDVVFDKNLLKNSLRAYDDQQDGSYKKNCKNLFSDGQLFAVDKMVPAGRPLFSLNTSTYKTINKKITELSLSLLNSGADVKLMSITSNDDTVWSIPGGDFPVTVPNGAKQDFRDGIIILMGSGDDIENFDFTLHVEDAQGKKYNYRVTSFDQDSGILVKEVN